MGSLPHSHCITPTLVEDYTDSTDVKGHQSLRSWRAGRHRGGKENRRVGAWPPDSTLPGKENRHRRCRRTKSSTSRRMPGNKASHATRTSLTHHMHSLSHPRGGSGSSMPIFYQTWTIAKWWHSPHCLILHKHSTRLHKLFGRHRGGVGEPQRLATQDAALAPTGSRMQHAFPVCYVKPGYGDKEKGDNNDSSILARH